jgi:hypothetical protein
MLSANPTIAQLGLLIVLSLVASGYTAIVLFSRDQREGALTNTENVRPPVPAYPVSS